MAHHIQSEEVCDLLLWSSFLKKNLESQLSTLTLLQLLYYSVLIYLMCPLSPNCPHSTVP